MMADGYSVPQLLGQECPQKLAHIHIIWRRRDDPETRSHYLTESRKLDPTDIEVTAARGYYIVPYDMSVLFLSHKPGKLSSSVLQNLH